MKKTYKNIDYEWLTKPTGDPFVDAGGYALEEFSSNFQDDDILQLIMRVTDIYVDRWNAKINPFFLNSKITQPAFKTEAKKAETKKYYEALLNNDGGKIGHCRMTGQKTYVFPAGRDNSVLTGSGTFINFHHGFQNGIMLSKEVIIRYFFLPLACEQLQGRIALISSNSPEIANYFSKEICKDNLAAIANNSSEGVIKSKSNNPSTSIFRYADKILLEYKGEFDDNEDYLTLYHFTNLGQKPNVNIYQLPSQVLRFYSFVQKAKNKDDWNNIVNAHYYYTAPKNSTLVKSVYNDDRYTITVSNGKKEATSNFDIQSFQYWGNTIYDKLLNFKSLTRTFLEYILKHYFSFTIIKTYEIKINNMKKETIEKIEQMADFIINNNDEDGISRAISKLFQVKSAYLLRRFVIKDIVAQNYKEKSENAIITVKDYTDYLFPDIDSWKETRDVLLIAIFEKLHERHENVPITNDENNE